MRTFLIKDKGSKLMPDDTNDYAEFVCTILDGIRVDVLDSYKDNEEKIWITESKIRTNKTEEEFQNILEKTRINIGFNFVLVK